MSGYVPGSGRTAPLFGTPRVATRTTHGRRVPVRHTAAGSRPKSAPIDPDSGTTNSMNKYDRMHSAAAPSADTVVPERRASPIRRTAVVEDEGAVMTKTEFISKYGGLREWEESHPAASIHDHHWFQEKLAEEEERGEMMTRKYREEIDKLTKALAKEKRERATVEAELVERTAEVGVCKRTIADQEKTIKAMAAEENKLRLTILELKTVNEALDKEVHDLHSKLNDAMRRIDTLNEENAELRAEMSIKTKKLTAEIESLSQQLRDEQHAREEAEEEINRMTVSHAKEKELIRKEMRQKMAEMERAFTQEKADLIEEWGAKCQALKKEMNGLKKKFQEDMADMEARYNAELSDMERGYKKQISELNAEWQVKYDALDAEWKAKYSELQRDYDACKALLEDIRIRLAKYENFAAMGAVNRMRNLALSKGWEKWQHEYKELVRLRKLMKGTCKRMQNRLLSKAFEKWQSEANKMTKQEYLMYRAIQKMLHFKLACAYDKWRGDYLEMKNMMKVFKNAAKRWRQQKLSKAWNQWRFVAAKMSAFLEGMTKEEMMEKLEAAYAKIAEQEAEIRELRQRLAKYEHFTALGAINRMLKLGLSKGWEKWQHEYAEQLRLGKLMKGTVRRMQNRLLSKAFEKWQFEANKLTKSEYLLQRALLRMMQLQLAKAWGKWYDDYKDAKALLKILKSAAKRWRQQKLSKAWNQWRFVAAKMKAYMDGRSKEELMQELSDALERIDELLARIAELERLRGKDADAHAKEIAALRVEFEKEKTALEREWQLRLNELQAKLDAANKKIAAHEIEMDKLRDEFDRDKARLLKEAEMRYKALQDELAKLQAAMDKMQADYERKLKESEDKYNSLVQQVEDILGTKGNLEDALSIQQTLARKLKEEVDRLKAELARLQGLETENLALKDQLRLAEQKLAQAMDVIAKLRDEVESLRADAAGQYAKLRAEVERITGVKMEIEGDLSNEKQVTGGLKDEISRLLKSIEELKKAAMSNTGSQGRINELEAEVMRLQGEVRRLERGNLSFTSQWETAIDAKSPPRSGSPTGAPSYAGASSSNQPGISDVVGGYYRGRGGY